MAAVQVICAVHICPTRAMEYNRSDGEDLLEARDRLPTMLLHSDGAALSIVI